VLMVIAEPSGSLAAELRRLLPNLREIAADGRRFTVCVDRGGWSPALFADILGAGFDRLTWRKGLAPDLPAAASPPSPALMTGAVSTNTTWPTQPRAC
jgi:hypothetical protein